MVMVSFRFEAAFQCSSKLYNEAFSSSIRISLSGTVSTDYYNVTLACFKGLENRLSSQLLLTHWSQRVTYTLR